MNLSLAWATWDPISTKQQKLWCLTTDYKTPTNLATFLASSNWTHVGKTMQNRKYRKGKDSAISYLAGIGCLYSPDFIHNHLQKLLAVLDYHFWGFALSDPYNQEDLSSLLHFLQVFTDPAVTPLMLESGHFLLALLQYINYLNVCHYSLNPSLAKTQDYWGQSSFSISLTDKSLIALIPWFVPDSN